MGELKVKKIQSAEENQRFYEAIIKDVQALDIMLKEGLFEKGVQRIGAEQELCLVDEDYNPSLKALDILANIDDPRYTTELARYNLEINVDPFVLEGDCFKQLASQLERLLRLGKEKAAQFNNKIILIGILPTIERRHLDFSFMTPYDRYRIISEELLKLRGDHFKIYLQGVDELITSLPHILFEACNTSFQTHLQIAPEDFVAQYNWSQLIAGPVLSLATNSPLLLGRELWRETRIALFKQSLDTRHARHFLRDKTPRVDFGNDWIRNGITDIYKDQVARFPLLITTDLEEDALKKLDKGEIPSLRALRLHNGTTYTWNRPCYGVAAGVAHLRIECRYMPSGPSLPDEIANFVFWTGLMKAMPLQYKRLWEILDFRVAKNNFIKAARDGLETGFEWFGNILPARKLILEELLPLAKKGLEGVDIDAEDIHQYLQIIEKRVENNASGSNWLVKNFRTLQPKYGTSVALHALTRSLSEQQENGLPVHEWSDVKPATVHFVQPIDPSVKQIMATDLFTVREDDPLVLVEAIIKWRNIRHMPVEDHQGNLLGVLSTTDLQKWQKEAAGSTIPVKELMTKSLHTVSPYAPISTAIKMMETHDIHCLPVVFKKKLVGILTDKDVESWKKSRLRKAEK